MPPTKNQIAATLSRDEAVRAGVLDAPRAAEYITSNSRKNYGFTRKQAPQNMPTEPRLYVFSLSEYGEIVDLGPGFPKYTVHACPEGEEFGDPCVVPPITFFEEAKVDVTEHTFVSGPEIADAILKIGPGMNASWDRGRIGWFVSKTNPPTDEEVIHAKKVYTQECQRLLAEGNRYAAANQLLEINETHRRAAKYLGQRVDWDKPQYKMVECVGCQEKIRQGAIIHALPMGCGAVQPGQWPAAISNGIKRLEDAPENVQLELARLKK